MKDAAVSALEAALLAEISNLPNGAKVTLWGVSAQAASRWARLHSELVAIGWYLDLYHARRGIERLPKLDNLHIECSANWPARMIDCCLLLLRRRGEGELARDVMQTAWETLVSEGRLVVGVDSPNDSWVRDQLRVFGKVNVKCSTPAFIVYSVTKSRPLRRRRDFRCQCTVRVGDRMLSIVTRPGVFAHRKIDGGARRLIRAIPVLSASRIMDLGCGSGAVALAVAAANPQAQILAVDSNARALACLAESLAINGVRNVQTELNCDGRLMCADRFQLLLANPPYYSNFRIARQFLETAIRYLEPGGRVIVVTKSPAWYAENWPKELSKFSIEPSSGYSLVSGTRV